MIKDWDARDESKEVGWDKNPAGEVIVILAFVIIILLAIFT